MAFRPAARTRSVSGMADVFRSDQTGEWSKTSVSMRPETRRGLQNYAAAHFPVRARHAHPGGHRPRARSLSRMTRDAVRNKQVPEPERCRAPPAAA